MKNQLRLDLSRPAAYRPEAFVRSAANAEAVERVLADWRAWPGAALALVGPPGSGKTHLARLWQAQASPDGGPRTVIEDVDRGADEDALFLFLNAGSGQVLLTARTRPQTWAAALPDLRSRFNALPVAELGPPDDAILAGVLENLFGEHNIKPAADLIPYLLPRMERSPAAARRIVEQLDEAAARQRREINRVLASQVLEIDDIADEPSDPPP